jgi:hypothetical protein
MQLMTALYKLLSQEDQYSVTVFTALRGNIKCIPLLPASSPRKLAAISRQHPILLTAVSGLSALDCTRTDYEAESYITTDGQSANLILE